jgi:hypothetical protein
MHSFGWIILNFPFFWCLLILFFQVSCCYLGRYPFFNDYAGSGEGVFCNGCAAAVTTRKGVLLLLFAIALLLQEKMSSYYF